MAFKRWMYQKGRPNLLAKIQNRGWALIHAMGVLPERFVTLEVPGRKSGKPVKFPLAMLVIDQERFLVSMLGNNANWVRNVQASHGKGTLIHGAREAVVLEIVEIEKRAPILKAYLQIVPGARPT